MSDNDRLSRILDLVNTAAVLATRARAETLMLQSVCAMLMVEIARREPNPGVSLEGLLARARALPSNGSDLAVDQTAFIDSLIRLAEGDFAENRSRIEGR